MKATRRNTSSPFSVMKTGKLRSEENTMDGDFLGQNAHGDCQLFDEIGVRLKKFFLWRKVDRGVKDSNPISGRILGYEFLLPPALGGQAIALIEEC